MNKRWFISFACWLKGLAKAVLTGVCAVISIVPLLVVAEFLTPFYDFAPPHAFEGPDVFDPYASLDPALGWKRANFHTHTKVDSWRNECEHGPEYVDSVYRSLGYDIVTFSNHNEFTKRPCGGSYPCDSTSWVNVYEHGVYFDKYHVLVFGSHRVNRLNHYLSPFASMRQWEMDSMAADADILQLNHPARTLFFDRDMMEKLSGYQLIELDSGRTVDQLYWDWALSAGHYSFGLANDDLHYPDMTDKIAVRCNFLNCPSTRYEDILACLRSGAFYSMRVPDYGAGDWDAKRLGQQGLPGVEAIGARGDILYLKLTETASQIRLTGQGGAILASASDCDSLTYAFAPEDTYARFTAFFSGGEVIYTNPFARYDRGAATMPDANAGHKVNWWLTISYNLALLLLAGLYCFAGVRIFKSWSRRRSCTSASHRK